MVFIPSKIYINCGCYVHVTVCTLCPYSCLCSSLHTGEHTIDICLCEVMSMMYTSLFVHKLEAWGRVCGGVRTAVYVLGVMENMYGVYGVYCVPSLYTYM